jgi:O-antigen/teichoic acid export membrane protein
VSSDELTTIAQKAAQGGLFLFIGNTSSTVILAVGSIIIARFLGPSSYGLYVLTLLVPSLLVSLADAGMSYALVRLPAKLRSENEYQRANRTVRLGFLLKMPLSAIAFLICYGGAEAIAATILNRPELAPFLRLASIVIVFQALFDAASSSFIGLDLMPHAASTQMLQSVLKSVLAPVLILLGFGLVGAISGHVVSYVAAGLVGAAILVLKLTHSAAGSHSRMNVSSSAELRVLLGYGLPLYLAALLTVFLSQYQSIVLAHFASNTEIGNFNAAWNFSMLMMILVYPITTAMFPMFSKMSPENQKIEIGRAFTLVVKYASLVMIPASVGVMVFSRDLILLTYGRGYTLAPQYLIMLGGLYLLTTVGYLVLGSFLRGLADTSTVLAMSALTLVIYLPLGPMLTWLWGPYGLLIGFVFSSAASTLYGVRRVSVKFGIRPDLGASGRILSAALAAAVPVIALIQLHLTGIGLVNLVAGGCLYLFAYLTLTPIVGAVDRFDIMNLRTILSYVISQHYSEVEMRFVASADLDQNRLGQNVLEIVTLEGNILDPTFVRRSQARFEEQDRNKAARAWAKTAQVVGMLADPVFDYEEKLLSAMGRR